MLNHLNCLLGSLFVLDSYYLVFERGLRLDRVLGIYDKGRLNNLLDF